MKSHAPGQGESRLEGGNSTEAVVLIDGAVHRPVSANGEYVHELLGHLEEVGFIAAPRFEGLDDQGREVLTYLEGDVPHNVKDTKWSDDQLKRAAGLLRGFHDATTGTSLAAQGEVVCHNDFAPWNVVFVGDQPTAIIDFDDATPGPRIRDVSYALWCWLGIGSEAHSVDDQAARLRLMCGEYGLQDLARVLPEIAERQQEIRAKHLVEGRAEQAEGVDRDIEWLSKNRAELEDKVMNP